MEKLEDLSPSPKVLAALAVFVGTTILVPVLTVISIIQAMESRDDPRLSQNKISGIVRSVEAVEMPVVNCETGEIVKTRKFNWIVLHQPINLIFHHRDELPRQYASRVIVLDGSSHDTHRVQEWKDSGRMTTWVGQIQWDSVCFQRYTPVPVFGSIGRRVSPSRR